MVGHRPRRRHRGRRRCRGRDDRVGGPSPTANGRSSTTTPPSSGRPASAVSCCVMRSSSTLPSRQSAISRSGRRCRCSSIAPAALRRSPRSGLRGHQPPTGGARPGSPRMTSFMRAWQPTGEGSGNRPTSCSASATARWRSPRSGMGSTPMTSRASTTCQRMRRRRWKRRSSRTFDPTFCSRRSVGPRARSWTNFAGTIRPSPTDWRSRSTRSWTAAQPQPHKENEMAETRGANAPSIILVPGFWLGAWAWDEVAAKLRDDGHDVTAITLPGLESADADRSSIGLEDHVNAIVRGRRDRRLPRRARRPQRRRLQRLRRQRPGARADRGDGLRRHRSRQGRDGRRLHRCREAARLGLDRGGGEPRRRQRGAEGDVPPARGPGSRRRPARLGRADERRAQRHPEHADLHRPSPPSSTRPTRRSIPSGRSSPASPSSATRPGSTCRRATGRCGRARTSSRRSSATSRRCPPERADDRGWHQPERRSTRPKAPRTGASSPREPAPSSAPARWRTARASSARSVSWPGSRTTRPTSTCAATA